MYRDRAQEHVWFAIVLFLTILFLFAQLLGHFPGPVEWFLSSPVADRLHRTYTDTLYLILVVVIWVLYSRVRWSEERRKEIEDIVSSIHSDLLLAVDEAGKIFYCSETVKPLLLFEVDEVMNQPVDRFVRMDRLIHVQDRGRATKPMDASASARFLTGSATGLRKSGEEVPLEFVGGRLRLLRGEVLLLRDITERRRQEQEVRTLTEHLQQTNAKLSVLIKTDPLTRTLNRRGFEGALNQEIVRARREGSALCVMIADCDDLKDINDLMGHGVGDVVLQEIAKTLEQTVRATDHIARIGGDEFLVLMPNTRIAEAAIVGERVRLAVQRHPLTISNKVVPVTLSIGISPIPEKLFSTEEVLALTAIPLKRSKLRGKNAVSCSGMHQGSPDVVIGDAASNIEELLRGDCFCIHAQPIVRLDNYKCIGYELLIRTTLPSLRDPAALFQFAAENNILNLVDQRCLQTCLSGMRDRDPSLRWHINLFPSTLLTIPVVSIVQQILPPEIRTSLCLELSEQQFVGDPIYLKEPVAALKDIGVVVAIDDVGFGRSSLESLVLLEPDIVKIDIRYVHGIEGDSGKRRALERTKKLVESLETVPIAEGIETEGEFHVLNEMGIKYGQGYYIQVPVPISEIDRLARQEAGEKT